MKKLKLTLLAVLAVFSVSCQKTQKGETTVDESSYVNASANNVWQYFSFEQNKVIGSADDSANSEWFARKDWDIAICRYSIRTNSGAATTVGASGGVYTFAEGVAYSSVSSVPSGAVFAEDKEVTSAGMGGTTTTVKSEATVIRFKTNSDGSLVMPPVYLQAPVYIFRSADGQKTYKVLFTQYKNEQSESGHVQFDWKLIK